MRPKKVLSIVPMVGSFGPSVLSGIYAYLSDNANWDLIVLRAMPSISTAAITSALSHTLDGIIVAANDPNAARIFKIIGRSPLPMATVDSYATEFQCKRSNIVNVRIDNSKIGRDAARAFLAQGRFTTFAFIGNSTHETWSQHRNKGFQSELLKRGNECQEFCTSNSDDIIQNFNELVRWLRRQEKPLAVLAEDDKCAVEVIHACKVGGLAVPSDVSVVGVDNDITTCESESPTISSLAPPFKTAAEIAARELNVLMCGKKRQRPPKTIICTQVNEFVRRQSTNALSTAGFLVQKAMTFIKQNADKGIRVSDVVAHLGVSRPLIDLRFREVLGDSVLSTILHYRLLTLKKLLSETNDPIVSITQRLGWSSPNYPKNLFMRKFHMTMRDFRLSNPSQSSSTEMLD